MWLKITLSIFFIPRKTKVFNSSSWKFLNTYISSDKDYYDGLLNSLDHLEIEVKDANGDLFEFNNADFSFSLEITEIIDIVQGTGVSARTGQVENYLEVLEE